MSQHVLKISTPVFRALRQRAPLFVAWSDEKPGSTQQIVLDDDVYNEIIDRAIAKRKTIDDVFLEACARNCGRS